VDGRVLFNDVVRGLDTRCTGGLEASLDGVQLVRIRYRPDDGSVTEPKYCRLL
jgi:hypothetical protein